ncbi:MAG TPA: LON peptidase substrate-binding domain-containing protein [Candidatus Kapabacteria bacterium]|jgi:ATP-dependent Lon protease|nr:LON peptidase substrate-binding domain-containing protein [Candidatus Kapabacteria bacterium]
MTTLGLFPLNIVLFPGSSYPLHIFESRYKQLIRESIDTNSEFGINLVESSRMFDVGCRASVTTVFREYDDGRMDIVVTGTERYTVTSSRAGEKLYLVGEIEPLTDTEPKPDPQLLATTVGLYNQLVESVYGEAEELLKPAEWMWGGASFRMAQKSGLDLVVRQQLLEMRSENERLQFLHTYLTDLVPKVRELEKIQALIRNDGYVR